MGANEKGYRLYSCRRCAKQVRICGGCDRGNRYCAEGCAQIRRRESRCRASERYQQSYRGALKHAARQRAWRWREQQKVTHQGSLAGAAALIGIPLLLLAPCLGPVIGFLVVTIWVNGPVSPLLPATYEPIAAMASTNTSTGRRMAARIARASHLS